MLVKRNKVYRMSLIALFVALMCILSPLSIPIGLVPITLGNLVVLLAVYLLGLKDGMLSCFIYILMGVIGLPVFSNFTSGLGVLLGPTGGFIIGYIPLAIFAGLCSKKEKIKLRFLLTMLGIVVSYLCGTIWFSIVTETNFVASLVVCVVPFIVIDIIKVLISIALSNMIIDRIQTK